MGVISENIGPFSDVGGLNSAVAATGVVASAAAQPAPTASITTISGTAALATIGIPWPGFTGTVTFIPQAAFTAVTGGTADAVNKPIGKAFTATVGVPVTAVFDGTTWWLR